MIKAVYKKLFPNPDVIVINDAPKSCRALLLNVGTVFLRIKSKSIT